MAEHGDDIEREERTGDHGWRSALVAAGDAAAWPISFTAVVLLERRPFTWAALAGLCLVGVTLHLALGWVNGLYRSRYLSLTIEEAGAIAVTTGLTGLVVTLLAMQKAFGGGSPYGHQALLAAWTAISLMVAHRFVRRWRAIQVGRRHDQHRTPVLVLGAGDGGYRAVKAMRTSKASPYRPVALLDDDPARKATRIGGLRVEGTSNDIATVAARHGAEAVLVAIPSASGRLLRKLNLVVTGAGLQTLVMPPVQKLVGEGSTHEIRRYRDEDVLNRRIVDIDTTAVHELVAETVVLVTGAGGSIGSELVRQLAALDPAKLVVVDRDDSLLHHVMASLPEVQRRACVAELADIRDVDRVHEVFELHRPTVVFHAAALKHVPALEAFPAEGWKTNVLGTANVIAACEATGVVRLVNISTDKAANPANVLGYTKRIAERLTAAAAGRTRMPYVSVRFGNVIGSRGSALETFEAQIAAGGPVTITHPDVTRYFMAVREAVRLTMQAATIGRPGEVLVLDMGSPVKVIDVATQLIEQSGRDIEIVVTGLRPGEKMHEELLGTGEAANRPFHSMIDHVSVPPLFLRLGLDACAEAGALPTTTEGLRVMSLCESKDQRASIRPSFRAIRKDISLRGEL